MTQSQKILDRLKKVECPFTWDLDKINEVIINHNEARTHDDENFVPLLQWGRSLIEVYEYVLKKSLSEAKDSLKSAEEVWDSVKTKHNKDVSIKVLENFYKGTKCFLLFEENKFDEIEKILGSLNEGIDYKKNSMDRSTLNGCKGIAWSMYKDSGDQGIKKVVDYIDSAIQDNPNCDVWHFLRGKNLRRQRRYKEFFAEPSKEEELALKKAYELSKEPTFGIYLAQLYKETRNKANALKIYKEIYDSKPESANINLRLALGFIRLWNLPLAKKCLDFAEEKVPKDSMFLHYKGIYFEKSKNFRMAAEYFKKASTGHNYAAEFSLLKCQIKLGETQEFVEHLKEMLITYKNYENRVLDLTLQLAASYEYCNKDISSAANCYLEAFEKFPDDKKFERHECIFRGYSKNVYNILKTEFLPKAFSSSKLDSEALKTCNKLQEICNNYYKNQRHKAELIFGNMRLS